MTIVLHHDEKALEIFGKKIYFNDDEWIQLKQELEKMLYKKELIENDQIH